MSDQPETPAHGCTIDGQPAMPILVSEYNQMAARAASAEAENKKLRDDKTALQRAVRNLMTGNRRHVNELEQRAEATSARVRALADRIQQGVPWTANADDIARHIHAALGQPDAADDLTGYTAPDPPIGCITATTAEPQEPTP